MTPRRAIDSDLPSIVALTQSAYAPYTTLLGAAPIPVTEDYAPRIARGEVWLLDDGTQPAGALTLERRDDHAMIFSVAVAPQSQGKGLGVALLSFAEQHTRLWGLPEIWLYTNAKMERNIALYLAYGFHETGRRPNPRRPGWMLVDMAKPVGDMAKPVGDMAKPVGGIAPA